MADSDETGDASAGGEPETIAMDEYKKLQRKLSRQGSTIKSQGRDALETKSALSRVEELLANLVDMQSMDDVSRSERAGILLPTMAARRKSEMTSAQVESELSQLSDSHDINWQTDERLGETRTLLDEMSRTGNTALGQEALRKAQEILSPPDAALKTEDIEKLVQEAVLKDRQDHGRVDTNTTVSSGGKVKVSDIESLDPRNGLDNMRETLNKALDQMYE
jgi:hypothetical protein